MNQWIKDTIEAIHKDAEQFPAWSLKQLPSEEPQTQDSPICIGCKKTASEIDEYIEAAHEEGMDPSDFVREEEGTYNPQYNTFTCTDCYVNLRCPSRPGGWVAGPIIES